MQKTPRLSHDLNTWISPKRPLCQQCCDHSNHSWIIYHHSKGQTRSILIVQHRFHLPTLTIWAPAVKNIKSPIHQKYAKRLLCLRALARLLPIFAISNEYCHKKPIIHEQSPFFHQKSATLLAQDFWFDSDVMCANLSLIAMHVDRR